jgi:uncharacterized OB-fold protein
VNTPFLPLADVETTVENQQFWDALRDGRIDLPFCDTCRAFVWYPRAICPRCHSAEDINWRTLPGTGRVYSYTIVAKGTGRWKDAGPYVVAYVQLDSGLDGVDGPRVLTNIVGENQQQHDLQQKVKIDAAVRMVVDSDVKHDAKLGEVTRNLLRFALA